MHPATPGGADESFDVRVDSKPSPKGASVEPAIPLADRLSLAALAAHAAAVAALAACDDDLAAFLAAHAAAVTALAAHAAAVSATSSSEPAPLLLGSASAFSSSSAAQELTRDRAVELSQALVCRGSRSDARGVRAAVGCV